MDGELRNDDYAGQQGPPEPPREPEPTFVLLDGSTGRPALYRARDESGRFVVGHLTVARSGAVSFEQVKGREE